MNSVKDIFVIFSSATMTVYTLCIFTNNPFYDKRMENKEKIKKVANTSIWMIGETAVTTLFLLENQYISTDIHSISTTLINIAYYFAMMEFFYYFLHRLMHNKYLYSFHKEHHRAIMVYPIDTYYISYIDLQANILTYVAPVFLCRLNKMEYYMILYMYFVFEYISHSSILYNHHEIHHRFHKYNYCFILPIFDILCNTHKYITMENQYS
jgi:sterol desaturase/sphingolipid hydroxylase (fatty acid hydroxylase superfamily)